jgi:hypothetical protein
MKKSKDDQDNKTSSGLVGDNILGAGGSRIREESKTIAFSSASDFNDTMVTSEATSNG